MPLAGHKFKGFPCGAFNRFLSLLDGSGVYALSQERAGLERAADGAQAVALLLLAPEFQRR